MTALGDYLYIVQGRALVRANPRDGSWQQLGNGTEWGGSTAMTALGNYLYIDQGYYLVRASPVDGSWNVINTIMLFCYGACP
jgi:hypothetical protein